MKIRRFAVVARRSPRLTLTACSGGKQEAPSAGGSAEVGTTNDINPQDVADLQQGGNLRLALTDVSAELQLAAHRRQHRRLRRHAEGQHAPRVPDRRRRVGDASTPTTSPASN